MKTAWTHGFMFVPIPPGWISDESLISIFGAGSNGSSVSSNENGLSNKKSCGRWVLRERQSRPYEIRAAPQSFGLDVVR
jgi:hypothetical protein